MAIGGVDEQIKAMLGDLAGIMGDVDKATLAAVTKACIVVQSEAKKNATTFPKVRTGFLRRSIDREVKQTDGGKVAEGTVGVPSGYPTYIELGTSKILPRRYLQRAYESNLKKIEEIIGKEIQEAIESEDYDVGARLEAGDYALD